MPFGSLEGHALKDMPLACPYMHTRKHIRLREFDYSSANAYFVTICTRGDAHHFGTINNDFMCLNEIGSKAYQGLIDICVARDWIKLDELVVMPNHVHCILEITKKASPCENFNQFAKPVASSVSAIINQYKGMIKKWCDKNGHVEFEWQPRFYDHVIREEKAYWAIKNYIIQNPAKWALDKYGHP